MKSTNIALVVIVACISGCSTLPSAQRVTTQEATHSYVLAGTGSPTVILESGLGDGKKSWAPIYDQIAQTAQVFAYDRAGYGASKSSNPKRDGTTIVAELRSTLQALDLAPPYILVGHSVGGTYMELYARSFPQEVAGVVLVDSRHADFTRQCQLAEARNCRPPAILATLLPNAPRQELAFGDTTMDDVMNGGPFPNVPLAVFTSAKQFLVSAKFYDVWLSTQKSLATLSADSTHTICKQCGHYVHKDEPGLVVSAVQGVIQRAREKRTIGRKSMND